MKTHTLLDEILLILGTVREDEDKLAKILMYLNDEICEKPYLPDQQDEVENDYSLEGDKTDLESVPVTSVCLSCKLHWIDNPEENLLCRIKRFEHRNDKGFKCNAYEKAKD